MIKPTDRSAGELTASRRLTGTQEAPDVRNRGTARRAGSAQKTAAQARPHGRSFPIGASRIDDRANFSVFSRHATAVDLLLFDDVNDGKPSRVISIGPVANRTYHYWHTFVPNLKPGQIYGYRVSGPFEPEHGLRFDPSKLLLDPYGRAVVVPKNYDRWAGARAGENFAGAMKSVFVDPTTYDWEGDELPRIPSARTIVYEMHVRGFTRNPNSGVSERTRGTYAGLIEKIPYLNELGHHRGRIAACVCI